MMTLMMVLILAIGDEPAAAPAAAQGQPAATPAQAADPDRPAISSSELKALRDNNIFAPRTAKKRPVYTSKESTKPRPSAPAQPKPPVVTGIFMDLKLQCYIVVVEDRNESSLKQFKEPKFLKTGDEACGFKVGPVTAEKAVFLKGETPKELRVGDPLGDGKIAAAEAPSDDPDAVPVEGEEKAEKSGDKTEIKPLDHEEKTKVLEKMKRDRGKKSRPSNDEQ